MKAQNLCIAVVALALAGCASTNKKLDEKVSQETKVQSQAGLDKKTADLIESSPSLTPAQKASLMALRDSARKQIDQIQADSLKLRTVLVEDVLAKKYNLREVAQIKNRMAKLDAKRNKVIFDTVEKANGVLGREPIENKSALFLNMIEYEPARTVY